MKKLLLILLLAGLSGYAQTYSPLVAPPKMQFLDQNGLPCAGCLLYTYQAGTTTPLATYTDATGTVQNQNPVQLDASGYPTSGVFLKNQAYKLKLTTAAGVPIYTVDNYAAGDASWLRLNAANGPLAGSLSVTGNITATGTISAPNIEGVRNSDQATGADVGAQVNATYSSCPSTGCRIKIPPLPSGACYQQTTPIVIGTNGKPALLEGDPGGATCLNYTPTTGTAITLDWGTNHRQDVGIRDIELHGPGSATATVGVQVGVTNGAEGAVLHGLKIGTQLANGFGNNVQFESAGQLSFASSIENSNLLAGGTCVNVPAGEESIRMRDTIVAQCATGISIGGSGTDLNVSNSSIDDNTTAGVSVTGGQFECYGCHFENINGGTAQYVTATNGIVGIFGGTMVDDVLVGTQAQMVSASGLSYIDIAGTKVNSLGRTVTQIVNFAGTARGLLNMVVGSANIASDFNTAYTAASVYDFPLIGTVGFNAAVMANASLSINSANGYLLNPRIQGSGAGTQAALFQPGLGTNAYSLVLNNPGATRTWTFSDTLMTLWGGLALPGTLSTYNGNATVGGGVPSQLYNTPSTAGATSIAATTMFTTPVGTTRWRFSYYIDQVAAGAACTGTTTVAVNLIFTDPNAAASNTYLVGTINLAVTGNGAAGNPGTVASGILNFPFAAKASTAIQYATTYTAGAACTTNPTYSIYPMLEAQ